MSVWGKREFEIRSHEHGRVFLTVAGTVSIKQGGDLVRLTYEQAMELQQDLLIGLNELAADNPGHMRETGGARQ